MIVAAIDNKLYPVKTDTFVLDDAIDERSTCNFLVVNKYYEYAFAKGEPVRIYWWDTGIVGSFWTFDESLSLIAGGTWDYTRESVAYDSDGEVVTASVPVYEDVDGDVPELLFSGVIENAEGVEFSDSGPLFYNIECIGRTKVNNDCIFSVYLRGCRRIRYPVRASPFRIVDINTDITSVSAGYHPYI